jgi:LysR family transcriptional regulator, low CO2-responsive transcriptional regulator
MAVTLTQLQAFLTVVRRGSVTAAAEELVVTQPSVSAAVSALERELGVELTERAGRSLRPTAAGVAYARYAADVLGLLDQGARAARDAASGGRGTLRLSAVTTAGEYLVAPLVRAYREHRPDVEISLDVGNRDDVFQRLADHEVDVALTGRVPEDARLHGETFADNEFVLIAAPEDPLTRRRWVAVEELADRPWLLREPGSGTRTLSEEYLNAHGLAPRVLEFGSNGAIKQAVRLGLGVALQSRFAVQLELDLGLLAAIRPRGGTPHRAWHVVRSAVGPARPEVLDFMEFTCSVAARHALARAQPTY